MPQTPSAIRIKLDELTKALRVFHSALLDFAKTEYEFLHGKIDGPFELYSLVLNNADFQWLRPLSGLMATLDEVLDRKDYILNQQNVIDVRLALNLLFDESSQFADFKAGYERAKPIIGVQKAYEHWRSIIDKMES